MLGAEALGYLHEGRDPHQHVGQCQVKHVQVRRGLRRNKTNTNEGTLGKLSGNVSFPFRNGREGS